MANQTIERIGVLLAHGIGEQLEQSHLVGEASNIILALEAALRAEQATAERAKHGLSRKFILSVQHHRRDPSRPLESRDPVAPLIVTVRYYDANTDRILETKEIHFREVFWADLDEENTLLNNLRFWFWTFSMWAVRWMPWQGNHSDARDWFLRSTKPAGAKEAIIGLGTRWQLLGTAVVFAPIAAALALLGTLSKKLGFGDLKLLDLMISYVGDVKLYQASHWSGGNRMPDIDQPPRIAIRRRMVRAMVDMALDGHDRWYILAHSLGTVIGLNGVMETQHCLPNHLDRERWELCQQRFRTSGNDPVPEEYAMHPRRPAWLQPTDMLDRMQLLAGLRLFLTYGSPLDKFATLFPQVVPINKDGLPAHTAWINVYDPVDPVAGHLDYFDNAAHPGSGPVNRSYRAHPVLLLNHTNYLKQGPKRRDRLVDWAANILLNDRAGDPPIEAPGREFGATEGGFWSRFLLGIWRTAQWGLVWAVFVYLIAVADLFLDRFKEWESQKGFLAIVHWLRKLLCDSAIAMPTWMLKALIAGLAVALVAGLMRFVKELAKSDQRDRLFLEIWRARIAKIFANMPIPPELLGRGDILTHMFDVLWVAAIGWGLLRLLLSMAG